MGAEVKLLWCENSTSKTLKMHLKMIIISFPFNEILFKKELENAILLINNSFFKRKEQLKGNIFVFPTITQNETNYQSS